MKIAAHLAFMLSLCMPLSALAQRATITCVERHWYDGEPRSFRIQFDDRNRDSLRVNNVQIPDRTENSEWYLAGFDDSRIGWCFTSARFNTSICYAVNRMTGAFTADYQKKGKQSQGSCSAGETPEGRKF